MVDEPSTYGSLAPRPRVAATRLNGVEDVSMSSGRHTCSSGRSYPQRHSLKWLSCAVALGFVSVVVFLGARTDPPHSVPAIRSSHGDSSSSHHHPVCENWCSPEKARPDCKKTGIDRTQAAFQDENCNTALKSSDNRELVGKKLEILADGGIFTFFRGSVALFYLNLMCSDPDEFYHHRKGIPFVHCNADAHPANFGVMDTVGNKLLFGVNDFDHTFSVPFTWDVLRGAAGFEVAAKALGFPAHDAPKAWINGYVDVIGTPGCNFSTDDLLMEGSQKLNEPKLQIVRDLLQRARQEGPAKGNKRLDKYIDSATMTFRKSKKIDPLPAERVPDFQQAVRSYLFNGVTALVLHPVDEDFYRVLSVAEKKKSGTGSVGLKRFYLFLQGDKAKGGDPVILEMKQATDSVLEQFMEARVTASHEAKRTVDGSKAAMRYANIFFGWVAFEGDAYVVSEKSRFDLSIDPMEIEDPEQLHSYAYSCGAAQAAFHLRLQCREHTCQSGPAAVDQEICSAIQGYFRDTPGIVKEMMDFAEQEAADEEKAYKDYSSLFRKASLRAEPTEFLNVRKELGC